jgi:DNA-binding CsgD family transcriptional regulator
METMEESPIMNNEIFTCLADKYELTDQQRKVFFLRLGEEKNYQQIAEELRTSINACQKCMEEVYKKFGIPGNTRGKERRLRKKIESIIAPIESGSSSDFLSETDKDYIAVADQYELTDQQREVFFFALLRKKIINK